MPGAFSFQNKGGPLFCVRNSQAKLRPANPASSLCSSKPGQASSGIHIRSSIVGFTTIEKAYETWGRKKNQFSVFGLGILLVWGHKTILSKQQSFLRRYLTSFKVHHVRDASPVGCVVLKLKAERTYVRVSAEDNLIHSLRD